MPFVYAWIVNGGGSPSDHMVSGCLGIVRHGYPYASFLPSLQGLDLEEGERIAFLILHSFLIWLR